MLASIKCTAAAGCLWLAGLGLSGCATAPPDPGVWVSQPAGTVSVYQRTASGSLGAGVALVTWTVGPEQLWQGRRVVPHVSPQAGTGLYDVPTRGFVAQLTPAGATAYSFDPPLSMPAPLAVGQIWTARSTMTVPARQLSMPYEVRFEVLAHEDVTVPAGRFKAFRVAATDSMGEVDTRWWVPSQSGLMVKREVVRPASHPQGAGRLEGLLMSSTSLK